MTLDEIKYARLSEPERFLLDIFDGLVEYVSDKFPHSIFYKKGDIVIFRYDSKFQNLYYSIVHIWVIFRDKFKLNYYESNKLVQSMVETILKLMVKTTRIRHFHLQ